MLYIPFQKWKIIHFNKDFTCARASDRVAEAGDIPLDEQLLREQLLGQMDRVLAQVRQGRAGEISAMHEEHARSSAEEQRHMRMLS